VAHVRMAAESGMHQRRPAATNEDSVAPLRPSASTHALCSHAARWRPHLCTLHMARSRAPVARCTLSAAWCALARCALAWCLLALCLHGSVEQDTRGRSASPRRLGAAPARRRPAHGRPAARQPCECHAFMQRVTAPARGHRVHPEGSQPASDRCPNPSAKHTHTHTPCNRQHATCDGHATRNQQRTSCSM
jgi:hypothetical protein